MLELVQSAAAGCVPAWLVAVVVVGLLGKRSVEAVRTLTES